LGARENILTAVSFAPLRKSKKESEITKEKHALLTQPAPGSTRCELAPTSTRQYSLVAF